MEIMPPHLVILPSSDRLLNNADRSNPLQQSLALAAGEVAEETFCIKRLLPEMQMFI